MPKRRAEKPNRKRTKTGEPKDSLDASIKGQREALLKELHLILSEVLAGVEAVHRLSIDLDKNPERRADRAASFRAFSDRFQKMIAMVTSPRRRDTVPELQASVANMRSLRDLIVKPKAQWEANYCEPYPRDASEMFRLLVRAGMDAETVVRTEWRIHDAAALVEGYLQRLADRKLLTADGQEAKPKPEGSEPGADKPEAPAGEQAQPTVVLDILRELLREVKEQLMRLPAETVEGPWNAKTKRLMHERLRIHALADDWMRAEAGGVFRDAWVLGKEKPFVQCLEKGWEEGAGRITDLLGRLELAYPVPDDLFQVPLCGEPKILVREDGSVVARRARDGLLRLGKWAETTIRKVERQASAKSPEGRPAAGIRPEPEQGPAKHDSEDAASTCLRQFRAALLEHINRLCRFYWKELGLSRHVWNWEVKGAAEKLRALLDDSARRLRAFPPQLRSLGFESVPGNWSELDALYYPIVPPGLTEKRLPLGAPEWALCFGPLHQVMTEVEAAIGERERPTIQELVPMREAVGQVEGCSEDSLRKEGLRLITDFRAGDAQYPQLQHSLWWHPPGVGPATPEPSEVAWTTSGHPDNLVTSQLFSYGTAAAPLSDALARFANLAKRAFDWALKVCPALENQAPLTSSRLLRNCV